jgi:hypothetical protein
MQTNRILLGALALLATGIASFAAGKSTSQGMPTAQPGKEHKWLASLAGEYTAKVGGMLGESEGTNRIESVLGGLWTVTHFETTIMNQPFKGIEIIGFDPLKKKFVSVWVDSMSTTLATMEGTYDAETKTLTMKGQSFDMEGNEAEMVNTTKYGDNGMVFAMNMEGVPVPTMTIDYARKK